MDLQSIVVASCQLIVLLLIHCAVDSQGRRFTGLRTETSHKKSRGKTGKQAAGVE